ncbi:hypothetical protein [Amycolatopsis sulphurea]|uniref:hypothetical protein n=1 Tax=Amycolatopsis sulphurea TaxID=76022 RepID=UPI0011456291|nr:hypothetical protein [Amycolatopsis sulphurea]
MSAARTDPPEQHLALLCVDEDLLRRGRRDRTGELVLANTAATNPAEPAHRMVTMPAAVEDDVGRSVRGADSWGVRDGRRTRQHCP